MTSDLVRLPAASRKAAAASTCSGMADAGLTPAQLAAAYRFSGFYDRGDKGQGETIGFIEYARPDNAAIAAFQSCTGSAVTVDYDPSPTPPTQENAEVADDVEVIAALAPKATVVIYADNQSGAGLTPWQMAVSGSSPGGLPAVISSSWGACEPDTGLGSSYYQAEETLFQEAASQGQTVLVASGDDGSEGCYEQEGTKVLAVVDPASAPDVTAVGGTGSYDPYRLPVRLEQPRRRPAELSGDGLLAQWRQRRRSQHNLAPSFLPGGRSGPVPRLHTGGGRLPGSPRRLGPGRGRLRRVLLRYRLRHRPLGGLRWDQPFRPFVGRGGAVVREPVCHQGRVPQPLAVRRADFFHRACHPRRQRLLGRQLGPVPGVRFGRLLDGCRPRLPRGRRLVVGRPLRAGQPGRRHHHASLGHYHYHDNHNDHARPNRGAVPRLRLRQAVNLAVKGTPVAIAASEDSSHCAGYWVVTQTGDVAAFGSAVNYRPVQGKVSGQDVVAIAATPDSLGYWLLTSAGRVLSFGDATSYGEPFHDHLASPAVGMTATPDGAGYWVAARDGGVFAYGDARFYGSLGGKHLDKPISGIAAAPGGKGYWLVGADGACSASATPASGGRWGARA